MPSQPQNSPLGTFLKALREEEIDCILIGAMAAIAQGAPLMTVDYDFWVWLPERQYVRLLMIVRRQGGTVRARTVYELGDGTQVNAVFQPDGLRSFAAEWKISRWGKLENVPVKVLPLRRVIASKRAPGLEDPAHPASLLGHQPLQQLPDLLRAARGRCVDPEPAGGTSGRAAHHRRGHRTPVCGRLVVPRA
ncbi:MAG: hypothetical protein FJ387_28575 [Verrucomicrobia bacterium]|nr:hypothetical protein [Verrucomicrobiota bacterium]